MPVYERVRADAEGEFIIGIPRGTKNPLQYLIAKARKKYRIYEAITEYSYISGMATKKGLVERDADGEIVEFDTLAEAVTWIQKGLPVD